MSLSLNIANIVILILTLYGALLTYIIASRNGYLIRLKSIKIPFVEFETSSFSMITAVKVFNNVSRSLLHKDNEIHFPKRIYNNTTLMVHLAWQLVCEAYVKEFLEYPSDTSLSTSTKKIGAQNIEFIKTYREIYKSAAKHGKISEEFAEAYASRAPSLARRIVQDPDYNPVVIWQSKIDGFQLNKS